MELHGVYVPLVTPFAADGAFAAEEVKALEALAHSLLEEGAAGLAALGTTAEAAALDEAERATVIEVCGRVCREHGVPLIVGAAGGDSRSTARAVDAVAQAGAAAALVTVPAFSRPGEAGVIAHFEYLTAECDLPLVVYNIPYRTGQSIGAATLRTIGSLPGVVGVKHAVGGIDQDTVDLLGDTPEGFAVLAGDDPYFSAMLALGAPGGILASAHLATGRFAELVEAWHGGELAQARELGHRLAALGASCFTEPNPGVIKGVLHAQGRIPSAAVRLPLLPASRAAVAHTLDRLAELGG
ncbi:dihydrodipicolinate synthase family protein [Kitasatospora sp. McL0602]|uniref:dihydrodipicolinate synthase family protein n=1 Tax=Kitasatospora sp. McL0602 TaxID=3439530 RepID=UPI003F88EE9C